MESEPKRARALIKITELWPASEQENPANLALLLPLCRPTGQTIFWSIYFVAKLARRNSARL